MRIAFLGCGAWATALAYVLGKKNENEVWLYGRPEDSIEDINKKHRNTRFFPDVELPSSIKATIDPKEAIADADILVLAVPSVAIPSIVPLIQEHAKKNPLLVNVIKGFDPNSGEGISGYIKEKLGPDTPIQGIVSLVGPSFAEDVIHDDLTCVCAVCEDEAKAKLVQSLFSSPSFRVYVQQDVIGAEIGAGMKNIIAIASGALEGLGFTENARAALITRGLAEITRFGLARGAKASTFLGLTGVGDLTLTASSMRSRNYSLGYEIGKEDEADIVLARNKKTVEGVIACKTIYGLSKTMGVETPIVDAVYRVLYEKEKPSIVIYQLMGRSLKKE